MYSLRRGRADQTADPGRRCGGARPGPASCPCSTARRRRDRWSGSRSRPMLRRDGTIHQISTVGPRRDRAQALRGRPGPPGHPRLAHRAAQPGPAARPPRAGAGPGRARAAGWWRCSSSTSTGSSRSTTPWATTPATSCWPRRPGASRAVVRPADTVARMGGDEFVILCGDVEDQDHATAVAQRVAAAIEAPALRCSAAPSCPSAPASASPCRSGGGPPRSHPARRRRGHVPGQGPGPGPPRDLRREHAPPHRRTAWSCPRSWPPASRPARSWCASSPACDLETGRVVCVEALARWDHPDPRADAAPTSSSALAEETGLIVGLGLRVLSTACEHGPPLGGHASGRPPPGCT